MGPKTTLADALQALAYLTGQASPPPASTAQWTFFVKSGVERLYRAFDFETAKQTIILTTDESGIADLSDYNFAVVPAFDYVGTDRPGGSYVSINPGDSANYSQGDRRYWIGLTEDNEWQFNSTEPNAEITVSVFLAPDITVNNQPATFTPMVVAKSALIYYRQSDDPEADTSVEEDQLKQEVIEIVDAQNRRKPQQFMRTARDVTGHYLGGTTGRFGRRH